MLTSSFRQHAFSSECDAQLMINVGTNEVCSPNKTFVIISCDEGAEFQKVDGEFLLLTFIMLTQEQMESLVPVQPKTLTVILYSEDFPQ